MVTITSNIAAFNAQGNIGIASNNAAASIARLSSGNRITKASDDVAGLATGTSLRTQVTTLRTSLQNASQGTSLLQVADGGLSQIVDILQRQKALAVQAGSGSLTDANRSLLNQEFQNLTSELDRIAAGTSFNGVSLLNGTLGASSRLVTTDVMASTIPLAPTLQFGPSAFLGSRAVEAFDINAGSLRNGYGTPGYVQLTDSSGTTELHNSAYDGVNPLFYGQFSDFSFSNVTYGAAGVGSGTLIATLNSVQYTGNVVSAAAGTNVVGLLSNGNTNFLIGLGSVVLTDAGTQATATNSIKTIMSTTIILRDNVVQGVDFSGTALAGAVGTSNNGNVALRTNSSAAPNISNFQYIGNNGADFTNNISVQVNGETYAAFRVADSISNPGGGAILFTGQSTSQILSINLTGMTGTIGNIRTNMTDRANFINALNQAFTKSGSALTFRVGSGATDKIQVVYGSATSASLYNNAPLNVSSTVSATNASTVLDGAITKVVSLRANVGALQSRFNFASNAIQSSIESQDAARSTLLDTDVAAESSAFASAQVRQQAGIAVLAQANKLSTNLLKLLR